MPAAQRNTVPVEMAQSNMMPTEHLLMLQLVEVLMKLALAAPNCHLQSKWGRSRS